ncbi:MAG TPA: potassium-transporting ATPase subunit KdpB, partial [Gammaproteobacteria bacterium]|nr:potassium-transporting ATPase subunit KdpB [Gammaproteobacteria bacterium]
MAAKLQAHAIWDMHITGIAIRDAFLKLSPRHQLRNPVMFTVYISALLTTGLFIQAMYGQGESPPLFILAITLWLWFTLLFANFAEAMAEGRGKAQAQALRKTRRTIQAKKLEKPDRHGKTTIVPSANLQVGDLVLVETDDFIPSDGEVIEGIAFVNESAITGESAPVIRESGGDRSAVTGGTQVISDWLIVRITSNPGETFLDRMIALVEGAKRQKTPNELALTILLAGLTIVFLLVCATLLPFSLYSVATVKTGTAITITVLVALFVCLAPTTIGGLLSAIGIAGMDRMIQANVIALSGRAVEAAGDIDVLLLDKTGTITLGNRQATEFIPTKNIRAETLAEAAQLASLADETPEGRSIVILAKEKYGLRGRQLDELGATFIPFSAHTRMSGANLPGRQIRKGASDAIEAYITQQGGTFPDDIQELVTKISRQGGTALVVADGKEIVGVIHLKDIVKGGIRERFAQLRQMGIKTIMVTGDNPLTAAAIAGEAGIDDFLA